MKKLVLNKEIVANISNEDLNNIQGGGFTSGCTDGCGVIFHSAWRCTKSACTDDCPSHTTDHTNFCLVNVNEDPSLNNIEKNTNIYTGEVSQVFQK